MPTPPRLHSLLAAAALLLATAAAQAQTWPHADASATLPSPPPPIDRQFLRREGGGVLSTTLGYGTNSAFYGRTQASARPFFSQELNYTSMVGVWGAVINYNLFNTSSFFDETDFTLGYDRQLSQQFDMSVAYSFFRFADGSPLVKSAVSHAFDGAVGYDWGVVYARLNASYLLGSGVHDAVVVLDGYRAFRFDRIFGSDDLLTLTPKLSVTAGTQTFAEASVQQQIERGYLPGPPQPINAGSDASNFNLLSYGARLPVAYTLGQFSLEASYRYLRPVSLLPGDPSKGRSYFSTTLTVTL